MFPTFPIKTGLILTPDTYIDFRVDGTTSMVNTYPGLQTAVTSLLKAELLPYYNNDSDWYDAHVSIFQTSNSSAAERPLYELAQRGAAIPGGDRLITIWFCDEASPYNAGNEVSSFDFNAARAAQYDTDMGIFRAWLATHEPNYWYGGLVQVSTIYDGPYEEFLIAIRDGLGNYSGTNGLSDQSNVVYKFGVTESAAASYYLEVIREVLNSMGVSF